MANGFTTFAIARKIIQRATAALKEVSQPSDPVIDGRSQALRTAGRTELAIGQIVRSGAGSYDYVVNVNGTTVTCAGGMTSGGGMSGGGDVSIYCEGARVLVFLPHTGAAYGVILCALPHDTPIARKEATAAPLVMPLLNDESGAGIFADSAYNAPFDNSEDVHKQLLNDGRPADLLPGVSGHVNWYGAGVVAHGPVAELTAGPGAKIRTSALDDQVAITSGHYKHTHALGGLELFDDCGYLTGEFTMSIHQQERAGGVPVGTPSMSFEEGSVATASTQSGMVPRAKGTVARKRASGFMGFLGNIFSFFISNPDPNAAIPETAAMECVDQGLMSMHADTSGRVHLRSASGFMLERWDRIPVPKRLKHAGDPTGDRVDMKKIPEDKGPFEFTKAHPYGRSLELRDAEAWRSRNDYRRMHERSQMMGGADLFLPEEEDMVVPKDEYNEIESTDKENFKDYDKRKAFIGLEPDGSIIFRDAWGGEVVMRGGSIIVTAPKQVVIHSGKSTVIHGGDDVIVRGRNSVDISATEHDVRIKGERNVQIVGGSDDNSGGVLIESLANSDKNGYTRAGGEALRTAGIVLKAKDSRVFTYASVAHISASQSVDIETFVDDKTNSGEINLSALRVMVSGAQAVDVVVGTETSKSPSVLALSDSGATLGGASVNLLGQASVGISKGSKIIQNSDIVWGNTIDDTNAYDTNKPNFMLVPDRLQAVKWLKPFDPDAREHIKFTHRTSKEGGTDIAIDAGMPAFVTYQPFWAYWAGTPAGKKVLGAKPVTWEEHAINGTYPWPGKETYEQAGAYVTLKGEENITADTGIPKIRSMVNAKPGGFDESRTFADFEAMS